MKRLCTFFLSLSLCLSLAVPALGAEFTDVPGTYVFSKAIQDCTSKGILSGYADGTFRPTDSVTRAQFCVMLVRAFYPGEEEAYAHLKSSGWFIPSAAVLEAHGAAPYGHNHLVDPAVMNSSITRNDMAHFMSCVMTAKGYTVSDEAKAAAQEKITDYANIPESYRDAIKTVFALGILTGFADGSFSGKSTMTRGQAAMVLFRMSQCLSSKPGNLTPVQQETAPAPTTLTNSKAVTEENVLALLAELKSQYPEEADFSMGYPLGESSPVRLATHPYFRAKNPSGHTSSTLGCGGWTTLASDAMFSQAAFPVRKTTLADARPGDIMIQLNRSGLLVHVAMITQRPTTENGKISFAVTEAATDEQDVYRIHWDVDYAWHADSQYTYDVWTRYPN